MIGPISSSWNLSLGGRFELIEGEGLLLSSDDQLVLVGSWRDLGWTCAGACVEVFVRFGKFARFFLGAGVGLDDFLLFDADSLFRMSMNSLRFGHERDVEQ